MSRSLLMICYVELITAAAPYISLGSGNCRETPVYNSHAWELAPCCVQETTLSSDRYMGWVSEAWDRCKATDACRI